MKSNILRSKFKAEYKIDAIQTTRSAGEVTYALNYVHWLEDKLSTVWKDAEGQLPDNEINVLCYHQPSGNYFICHRTLDCLTQEPKWYGGAMPTHWRLLDKPTLKPTG